MQLLLQLPMQYKAGAPSIHNRTALDVNKLELWARHNNQLPYIGVLAVEQ